jgi:hypothetical protein
MQPLAGVRGMDRDVLDRRWGELGAGQGGAARCAAAHQPRDGLTVVRPAMVVGEAGGDFSSEVEKKVWVDILREFFFD